MWVVRAIALGLFTGDLVWRRLPELPAPSHHAIRSTCMQLLPLVEMFCKWELQEDCANLGALVSRFDSKEELGSHELGRALLCMVNDDEEGFGGLPQVVRISPPSNPFEMVRERLAAMDLAIGGLRPDVHVEPQFCLSALIFPSSHQYTHLLQFAHKLLFECVRWMCSCLAPFMNVSKSGYTHLCRHN